MANTFYPIAQLENDILALAFGPLGGFSGRMLEGFIDETLAEFNKLNVPGYRFADPQSEVFYEQTVEKVALAPMAQYVDYNSDPIPYGVEGGESYTGKIPRMKSVEIIDEEKAEKIGQKAKLFGPRSGMLSAQDELRKRIQTLIVGHKNACTYQRMQMNSKGEFNIVVKNNTNGIRNVNFKAHIPATNFITPTGENRWWKALGIDGMTYSTEGSASDPIADMQDIVRKAKLAGLVKGHFEVNTIFLDQILKHSAVLAYLGLDAQPNASAADRAAWAGQKPREWRKAKLEEAVGRKIVEFDDLVAVEVWDKAKKALKRDPFYAFENGRLSYVPDGIMGEFQTKIPYAVSGGQYARFMNGLGLITIEADYTHKIQTFTSELTTIGLPIAAQYVWIMNPVNL